MGANCNVTPQFKKIFYYRFDLTKKTPPPPGEKFKGANCNVTPQLKKFFYYRFDLTNFDSPPKKIKGNLDLGRFDLTNFDHSHSTNHQHPAAHSRHNKNHVLPKHSTMLKSISCLNCLIYSFRTRKMCVLP